MKASPLEAPWIIFIFGIMFSSLAAYSRIMSPFQNYFKVTQISKIMSKIAERLLRTGIYTMSEEEAASMIKEAAYKLNIDLKKADLKRTRDILKRGKPLSRIVVEMRER